MGVSQCKIYRSKFNVLNVNHRVSLISIVSNWCRFLLAQCQSSGLGWYWKLIGIWLNTLIYYCHPPMNTIHQCMTTAENDALLFFSNNINLTRPLLSGHQNYSFQTQITLIHTSDCFTRNVKYNTKMHVNLSYFKLISSTLKKTTTTTPIGVIKFVLHCNCIMEKKRIGYRKKPVELCL